MDGGFIKIGNEVLRFHQLVKMMEELRLKRMIHYDIKEHYDGGMVYHKTNDVMEKTRMMKALNMMMVVMISMMMSQMTMTIMTIMF
jgi:hypothetical protein